MEGDDAAAVAAVMMLHGCSTGGSDGDGGGDGDGDGDGVPCVVGGSVTMPLKRSMMQQCALLSPAAACIGCVNTLSLQTASDGTRHIAGDNTDWAGMLACLTRIVKTCSNSSSSPITCAVIIGSGATARSAAFALAHLPQITSTWICNRTRARAAALAAEFDVESFGLDAQEAPQGMRGLGVIVISTVSCSWCAMLIIMIINAAAPIISINVTIITS